MDTQNNQSGQTTPTPPQTTPTTPIVPTFSPSPSGSTPEPSNSPIQKHESAVPVGAAASSPAGGITPPEKPETPSPSLPMSPSGSDHSGGGKMIFVIVIVLAILAAIGGYLLFTFSQSPTSEDAVPAVVVSPTAQPSPTEPVASESALKKLEDVSSSDEIDALEKDLENSDFSTIDEELSTLEQEL